MFYKLKGNSLIKGSAVYLFSNILNAAIPFALLPVLTRFLEPAEYGQVAMYQVLLGILGAFVGLNVAGSVARKYYDDFLKTDDLQRFIGACFQIMLLSGAVIFVLMIIFGTDVAFWMGLPVGWVYLAVLVSMAAFAVRLRLLQWQVRKQAVRYGEFQVSQGFVNMALSLTLVVGLLLGSEGRIIALSFTTILFALAAIGLLFRDRLINFLSWSPRLIKDALSHGVPLIPHAVGLVLLASFDRLIINDKLGLAEAGIYMVAAQLAGGMALFFDAINKAYVPWLFEHLKQNRSSDKQRIVRLTYICFFFILLATTIIALSGPWLVVLVAGQNYSGAGSVIGWLALGQAFGGFYLMVTNYIIFSKRTGLLSLVTISSGLVNIILLIFMVEVMGIEGAAIAFCVSMAIRFFLTWWVAQRLNPMPWFNIKSK
ncbi:lipopolysaccharide biosynthesis protein [Marinobacter qingdaonensis]|uniref:Oligosaccharide flippase family protein n=1 Tax=Marinobacter qingdaonensis TaxID=3108486 RepID=A0ABU5P035_9GAMM|nr:oligosaccharide flippase family protein [Marinobacter sp. ASW11-75]MEA1081418.1 oligosaccharide flippase family protein [Marinobacter sp. ASW11-75]